jgi:hypothetical protein
MISGLGFENEQNRRITVERCLASAFAKPSARQVARPTVGSNLDSREKAQKAQKRKTSSTADGRRFTQMGEGSRPRDPLFVRCAQSCQQTPVSAIVHAV